MYMFLRCTCWMPESAVLMSQIWPSPSTTVWGHSTVKLSIFWRQLLEGERGDPPKQHRARTWGRGFPQASLPQDLSPWGTKPHHQCPQAVLVDCSTLCGYSHHDIQRSTHLFSLIHCPGFVHQLCLDHIPPLLNALPFYFPRSCPKLHIILTRKITSLSSTQLLHLVI